MGGGGGGGGAGNEAISIVHHITSNYNIGAHTESPTKIGIGACLTGAKGNSIQPYQKIVQFTQSALSYGLIIQYTCIN